MTGRESKEVTEGVGVSDTEESKPGNKLHARTVFPNSANFNFEPHCVF